MGRTLVKRYRVGILGATGLVGQRLIERLRDHPWFDVQVVAASSRSVGRAYSDAAQWCLDGEVPPGVAGMRVRGCGPADLAGCDLVLSALDSATAREIEPRLREAGLPVISNSSAHRMMAGVPLVIPEVNPSQLDLVRAQRERHGGGFIVTNPNCSAIGLALGLAPLHRSYGLKRIVVTTMQAISGAGLDGPRALDLLDNVVPYIAGEEEKLEQELAKIFGEVEDGVVRPSPLEVSAHCHRVGVRDGHLEAVSMELGRSVEPEEAVETLRGFTAPGDVGNLPSSVPRPIRVRDEIDRPQPRLDRNAGEGMAVVIGRVRRCPVLGLKMEVVSHNAIRGAAGGTLLVAELLAERGLVGRSGA